MDKKGYIYKITSPSGYVYIGKTINLKNRINKYKCLDCKRQILLCRSLEKYGFSGHSFEIIYEGDFTNEELNKLEIYYIGYYNSFNGNNKDGMNLTLGGEGVLGKKHTEETKKRISENRKKTGKTEKHQQVIDNMKGKKLVKTKEWINKNAESIKKPILQYDLLGNLIKEWKSAQDVEIEIGLSRKNISANLRNKSKHAYGYIWKYKEKV
jgi:group I intron endonuclease